MMAQPRHVTVAFISTLIMLFAASVWVQRVRDRRYQTSVIDSAVLYVPSGAAVARGTLSFDALMADVYWIRAIQHYGSTKRSTEADKNYDLLFPLLDIATTLDPRFNIAYRFGAIFLTEAYPDGPGQPEAAIALLQKGVAAMPDRWQYLMDIGFVHYWWLHDYEEAARWFSRASLIPDAPWWLESMAATTLAQGGNRVASRQLWQQILDSADNEWLQEAATRRLVQLAALDGIDELRRLVDVFVDRTGERPRTWAQLVDAGLLRGRPVDPTGTPYLLNAEQGVIDLSRDSPLYPLPVEPPRLPSAQS